MADDDEPRGHHRGGLGRLIALAFVLVLALFSVWLVNRIIADVKLQNCVLTGRRDCMQILPDNGVEH